MSKPPRKIGKYRLRSVLGSGGMAKVYEAHDRAGGRVLALKVLDGELARTPDAVESFVQAGQRAIQLARHDHVLTVFEADRAGDTAFLAMQLLDGDTLRDELRARGALPLDRVRTIVAAIGGALAHAHQQGIVHGDVKPSDIMSDAGGRPYLLDFGIAHAVGDMLGARLDDLSAQAPQYASPERTRGQPATARSDIYSLGAVVYEMVTGTTPFGHCQGAAALRAAVLTAAPCPPRDLDPAVPEGLERAILRALTKEPAARFDTVAQFTEAVLAAIGAALAAAGPTGAQPSVQPGVQQNVPPARGRKRGGLFLRDLLTAVVAWAAAVARRWTARASRRAGRSS